MYWKQGSVRVVVTLSGSGKGLQRSTTGVSSNAETCVLVRDCRAGSQRSVGQPDIARYAGVRPVLRYHRWRLVQLAHWRLVVVSARRER